MPLVNGFKYGRSLVTQISVECWVINAQLFISFLKQCCLPSENIEMRVCTVSIIMNMARNVNHSMSCLSSLASRLLSEIFQVPKLIQGGKARNFSKSQSLYSRGYSFIFSTCSVLFLPIFHVFLHISYIFLHIFRNYFFIFLHIFHIFPQIFLRPIRLILKISLLRLN